jgi:hypothetical protein
MASDIYAERNKLQQPWDAIRECLSGKARLVASDIGLSESTLKKWQEPHGAPQDSGARSPVETVRDLVFASMRRGTPEDKALQPLYWLANECNLTAVPLPKSALDEGALHQALAQSVKEFGDVAGVFVERIADGEVTPSDAREFQREMLEHIRCLLSFHQKIQGSVR